MAPSWTQLITVGATKATAAPVKYGTPWLMKMASSIIPTSTTGTETDRNTTAMIRKMAATET